MKIFHLKDGKMEKSNCGTRWRQKEEFFKSIREPQKQQNKQGKWVYNGSELIEMMHNIRNMLPIDSSYKI